MWAAAGRRGSAVRCLGWGRRAYSEPDHPWVSDGWLDQLVGQTEADETASALAHGYQRHGRDFEAVYVVQPLYVDQQRPIELGPARLAESLSLVRTLEWMVLGHRLVQLKRPRYGLIRGAFLGQIEAQVARLPALTAIFVSDNRISESQRAYYEAEWGLPVLDRFNLVLRIFHRHARTREARLQVALAQAGYLAASLTQHRAQEDLNKHSPARLGRVHFDRQAMVLKDRRRKIWQALNGVRQQREKLRQARRIHYPAPTVAVVGYTNSGKTSLIKALTGAEGLSPQDRLFATLDVTVHEGRLPNAMPALFLDTVGFISDIPTELIASFSATLEDATQADLIIHVRDISHVETELQNQTVLQTLARLNVPQRVLDSMIEVGNKMDLVPTQHWARLKRQKGMLPISVNERLGLDVLLERLQKSVMALKRQQFVKIRCRHASSEHEWLQKNNFISSVQVDESDYNYVILTTVMSPEDLAKFKHHSAL